MTVEDLEQAAVDLNNSANTGLCSNNAVQLESRDYFYHNRAAIMSKFSKFGTASPHSKHL